MNVCIHISKKALYMPGYVWSCLWPEPWFAMTINIPSYNPVLLCQSTIINDGSYWKVCVGRITPVNWFKWYLTRQGHEDTISSLMLSTSEPLDIALVCRSNCLVIIMATVDYNECVGANINLKWTHVGEGTISIDSKGQRCNYVFMNVERLGLPTRVGSPNFWTFDYGRTLLTKANAQMFNSIRAINPRYGIGCGSQLRFATSWQVKVHIGSGHSLPWGYYVCPITWVSQGRWLSQGYRVSQILVLL